MRKQDKTLIIVNIGFFLWEGWRQVKSTIAGINIRALFSRNLKRLRTIANFSQVGLAVEAGLAHNFINDIENGKKWVSPETIAKLSKALKAEPYQFFISDSKWNDQVTEMFSMYLDDIETTHARMVAEYRSRFLPDDIAGEESGSRRKKHSSSGTKKRKK